MKIKTAAPRQSIGGLDLENASSPMQDKTMSGSAIKKAMPLSRSPLQNSTNSPNTAKAVIKVSKSKDKSKSKSKDDKKKRSRDKESSKESKRAKSASPVAAPAPKPAPKPAEYPATKMPPAALVKSVYEARGGKGKVTIDDAIVSICKNENEELKRLQGQLQRKGSDEDIDAVQRARVAVKDIEARAIEALGVARAERAALVEAAKQNNPQNRALWKEVNDLNEALQILRQEEKATASAASRPHP
ncbi:hypothetical protein TeGR_g12476 [Tetraparma gracilis]|uniref:Uncharacterized protein n=1 Tax=Tetraparma gracilis TaxID=2962635 RepID=A0ABQ6MAY7_9STRA|nr:hypothetical protein TeGR_g12476 [Tetraparma gracilis]